MISYLDETANLIVNKDVIDLLNKARENPDVAKYLGKSTDDIARTILGLHDISPAMQKLNKAGTALSALAIIPSTTVMAMSAVTTLAR